MKAFWITDEKEKPLDTLVKDGGFCGIFRRIGCVGDSLSSGEYEIVNEDGTKSYYDLYEYSWGQFISYTTGSKVYNFSRGGMTASWYNESFAEENDFWNPEKACQAYIIALGDNDLFGKEEEVGSIAEYLPGRQDEKQRYLCGGLCKDYPAFEDDSAGGKIFPGDDAKRYRESGR